MFGIVCMMILVTDRQMDGHRAIALYRAGIASHGKNELCVVIKLYCYFSVHDNGTSYENKIC